MRAGLLLLGVHREWQQESKKYQSGGFDKAHAGLLFISGFLLLLVFYCQALKLSVLK